VRRRVTLALRPVAARGDVACSRDRVRPPRHTASAASATLCAADAVCPVPGVSVSARGLSWCVFGLSNHSKSTWSATLARTSTSQVSCGSGMGVNVTGN
jgi:hypothetical protein